VLLAPASNTDSRTDESAVSALNSHACPLLPSATSPETFCPAMPEFCCVQCYSCQTFQAQQVKKVPKFTCKICTEKQSFRKVYATSTSAKDVRLCVQRLNMQRGEAAAYADEHAAVLPPARAELPSTDAASLKENKWAAQYQSNDSDAEPLDDDAIDGDSTSYLTALDTVKKAQRGKRPREASSEAAGSISALRPRPSTNLPRMAASMLPAVLPRGPHQPARVAHAQPAISRQAARVGNGLHAHGNLPARSTHQPTRVAAPTSSFLHHTRPPHPPPAPPSLTRPIAPEMPRKVACAPPAQSAAAPAAQAVQLHTSSGGRQNWAAAFQCDDADDDGRDDDDDDGGAFFTAL
jgi:hypothetical protein